MFSDFLTPEELTWLQASVLFENPLSPAAENGNISQSSESVVSPSKDEPSSHIKSVLPATPPRSEWIYRTPKSLSVAHSSPRKSRPFGGYYPPSLSRSRSNASSRTVQTSTDDCHDEKSFSSSTSFFSSVLQSRTRPPLRPIPSESQLTVTPPEVTPIATAPKSIPRLSPIKTPSLSLTLDGNSLSHSPTSSRSDSPVTPVSLYATYPTGRRRSYDVPRPCHRRGNHSTEIPRTSTPHSSPSKPILTRTASVSTRASSHTVNKSVTFATIPTVHYATRAYWDVDVPEINNIGSMDLDDDPFANYRSREGSVLEADEKSLVTHRSPRPSTPTSVRSKKEPKRIKRLIRLTRKSVDSDYANKNTSERPVISSPYALGSYPGNTYDVEDTESSESSLISRPWMASSISFRRNSEAAGSVSSVALSIKNGLARSKTSGAVSLRSVESTSSRAERFRSWLSRTVGWTQA